MNVTLHIDGKPVTLENITRSAQEVSFVLGGTSYTFHGTILPDGGFVLERRSENGVQRHSAAMLRQSGMLTKVQVGASEAVVSEHKAAAAHAAEDSPLSPTAPMPGLVRQVLVKAGERVKKGQALAVMEAMKLQTTLAAGGDATVEKVLVREGELVAEGAELVRLKPL